MKIIIYIIILLSKIIENALSTLRIIVVASGKKVIGSILQGLISLIWVFSTGLVVVNVLDDPIKILAFTIGSLIGSYIGSIIEEKLALGTIMLTIVVKKEKTNEIIKMLNKENNKILILNGLEKDKIKNIIMIIIERKNKKNIINKIKKIDTTTTIIIENAYTLNNHFNK